MRRLRSWFLRFRWQKLLVIWLVFGLMAAALFAERSGVQYTGTHLRLNLLDTGLTKEGRPPVRRRPAFSSATARWTAGTRRGRSSSSCCWT